MSDTNEIGAWTEDAHGVVYDDKGRVAEEGQAIAVLLKEEKLFVNQRKTWTIKWGGDDGKQVIDDPNGDETVVVYILCNDVFMWACSDAEPLHLSDVHGLYEAWKASPSWGCEKWLCVKRNEKPQGPLEKIMRDSGIWDDQMEALPENRYDAVCRERALKRKAEAA